MSQVQFQQSLTDEIAANDKIASDAYNRAMDRAEGQKYAL